MKLQQYAVANIVLAIISLLMTLALRLPGIAYEVGRGGLTFAQ
jgi:hypothetical protein